MKKGIVISILPYLFALLLFYSLAIHMHQSLNGWPERIGTNGFPAALLLHDQILSTYITYLLLFTIFVMPAIILVCLLVSRWRHLVVYFVVHLVSLPVCYGLISLLPRVISTGGGIDDIMTNSDLREKKSPTYSENTAARRVKN